MLPSPPPSPAYLHALSLHLHITYVRTYLPANPRKPYMKCHQKIRAWAAVHVGDLVDYDTRRLHAARQDKLALSLSFCLHVRQELCRWLLRGYLDAFTDGNLGICDMALCEGINGRTRLRVTRCGVWQPPGHSDSRSAW